MDYRRYATSGWRIHGAVMGCMSHQANDSGTVYIDPHFRYVLI